MPLYEYRCQKCDHMFEKIQKFSDKPRAACPACGGAGKRQLSAPAIHFKGSGWYITDYARKGKSGEEKAPGEKDAGKDAGKDGEKVAGKTKDSPSAAKQEKKPKKQG